MAGFTLPSLRYSPDALQPALSSDTFAQHHQGHHQAYVDKLNSLADEAGMSGSGLIEIVAAARGSNKALFNNAAQHFNHAFYWASLTPEQTAPTGELKDMIEAAFGSTDALVSKMVDAGATHFASGWAWLVKKGEGLAVVDTHDADTPVDQEGQVPLLVLDVWEHAYYLDHQRNRKAYLDAVAARHLNWAFAAEALAAGDVRQLEIGIENRA